MGTYLLLGQHERAKHALNEAMEVFANCGEDKLKIASTRLLMGRNFRKLGLAEDARQNFEVALAMTQTRLRQSNAGADSNHPRVADCLLHFGSFLAEEGERPGDATEAHTMLTQAQRIYEINFGEDNDKTLEAATKLKILKDKAHNKRTWLRGSCIFCM